MNGEVGQYKNSIRIFSRLKDIYSKLGDTYRARAYENAIKCIVANKTSILSPKLKAKIDAIEKNGFLEELDRLEKYERLLNVKGFGISLINKLIKAKIYVRRPEELLNDDIRRKLKDAKIELTSLQLINLKYYKELNKKIERKKVTSITSDLKSYLHKKNIKIKRFEVVGSYRRGKELVGDIDILLISDEKQTISNAILMSKIYAAVSLYRNYLTKLVKGNTKYSFLLKHEKDIIQVDIRIFPERSYHTALLYFTGSGEFNTQLRSLAKEKGFILNEYELKEIGGKPINITSEKDIFDKLGVKYLSPKDREKITTWDMIKGSSIIWTKDTP